MAKDLSVFDRFYQKPLRWVASPEYKIIDNEAVVIGSVSAPSPDFKMAATGQAGNESWEFLRDEKIAKESGLTRFFVMENSTITGIFEMAPGQSSGKLKLKSGRLMVWHSFRGKKYYFRWKNRKLVVFNVPKKQIFVETPVEPIEELALVIIFGLYLVVVLRM